jgi:hypothetical protein
MPSENVLVGARYQGRKIVEIASRLHGGSQGLVVQKATHEHMQCLNGSLFIVGLSQIRIKITQALGSSRGREDLVLRLVFSTSILGRACSRRDRLEFNVLRRCG